MRHYSRGGRELLGPLHRWGPRETVAWFAARGVALKTEADGRMFPVTDDSGTIVDCLRQAAEAAGVTVRTRCGVQAASRGFEVALTTGETMACDRLLLATGGCRAVAAGELDTDGIALVSPVDLNSGTLEDAAGNNAALTFTSPSTSFSAASRSRPGAPLATSGAGAPAAT